MTANELLPCPFCGGEAELTSRDGETPWDEIGVIYCPDCNSKYENTMDLFDPASTWNRRAPLTRAALAASPLVQEIVAEAVKAALDDVTTMHRVIADVRMATVGSKPMLSELAAALVAWRAEAVEAEREACARVCETLGALGGVPPNPRAEWKTHADNLADAIRARGE